MINKVTLIGNLGGDPEVRHLENGTAVGRFSLATNENYKDKDGNWQKLTEWHNIVVWRDQAERAEKQLKKGMTVFVEGKISYRKYTGQDGVERNVTDIVANTVRSLEKSENSGSDSRFPATEPTRSATAVTMPADAPPPADGDDLPF
ncbi:MAG: single-stranded DNA-binding protein [Saprospiraceae bacterium]|nr:single-stranded DNA-binding protein [Saprospiraceae bacterium]